MAEVRPLGPGDPREIAGYVLHGRLGAGGMGTVYLSATRGGQPVAVKAIHHELAEDPKFRRRFEQEVRAARRVRGRYIVPVLDSNTEGPLPWLATEYVPGPSLARALARHGPLLPSTSLLLMAGVADALGDIHAAHIVHRDLKPSNILLTTDGPAVIDFGIARAAEATPLTGTDTRVGTPAFMAPEQIRGNAPATPAIDVFALGLTVHVAATGVHPFGEGPAPAVLYRIDGEEPDLTACPDSLRPVIARCLAKDPAARPTPAEVVELCRQAGAGLGLPGPFPGAGWLPPAVTAAPPPYTPTRSATIPAAPPPLPPPPPPPARRPAAAIALGAALATVTVVALVAWLLTGDGDEGNGAATDPSPSAEETPEGESGEESPQEEPPPEEPSPEETLPPAYEVIELAVDFEAVEEKDGEGCGCWTVTARVVNNGDLPVTLDGEFTLEDSLSPGVTDWYFDEFTLAARETSVLFVHYPQADSCRGTYRMEVWGVAPEGPPVSDTIFAACEP
ncbi:serine/threonine-protein kinase [Streptomyces sp. MP131-18]|uniref:serine/threonine-protein kinase n=1 Tax=Streptomyces sp. MP131-18 TaxID=1857892 RepID=UPI00097C01F3|nr:serine/threonine-protein kinase [Streptomyces sp. MP131-18]ONK13783.1 Serine/threonine-protein kinase AfsK [Streptomyces sp. MP131-18]